MSLFWAVPPVAVAFGAVIVLTLLRDITTATADIADQFRRLDEVRVAVASVRADAAQSRTAVHRLRSH